MSEDTSRYFKKKIGLSKAANLGVEKINEWISDFSKHYNVSFSVREIDIQPVRLPDPDDKASFKTFQQCVGKGETKHHAILKWFGYNFIQKNLADIIDFQISFETQLYLPNTIYWANSPHNAYGRFLGKGEDVSVGWCPQSLKHGPMFWIQEADVSCRGSISMECGVTSTMSLAMPIITGAASKVFWLPYPVYAEKNKEWADFETPVKGFVISRA